MIYLILSILMLFIGFKLGTKYQSLIDIMTARRISKLIETANKLQAEKEEYARYQRLETVKTEGMNQNHDY